MISVTDTRGYMLDMELRMPFHFGDTELTALPHLFLEVEVDIDGTREQGLAAEGLSPLWFVKDPDLTFTDGLDDMLAVVEQASAFAETANPAETVFDCWYDCYERTREWGEKSPHPALLWGFGPSMIERGLIDAYCTHAGTTFGEALRAGDFGIDLGTIYPSLSNRTPAEFLPDAPCRSLSLRHTVGFTDPLTDADVGPGETLDDELPQTLAEYVEAQELTHFKVKLSGDGDADVDRLRRLAEFFEERCEEYLVTLDANEQYGDASAFKAQWRRFEAAEGVDSLLNHIRYVEQPLARHEAFTTETESAFTDWEDGPSVIIDESDARVDSLGRALECGYAGTSHKNCKGVFRGVINACLLAASRERDPDGEYILSAEDLTTVGPVSLLQDLAVVAQLGVDHVERNGHHYFTGLKMLPDDYRDRLLAGHGDLYHRRESELTTLTVEDSRIDIGSVVDAPFGYDVTVDPERFTPASEWSFTPDSTE
ncbi:enolase-like domain-containing protein [Halorussus salinisoli]|uniref:hypothetical protein n=1 Tax=Halorussus salinisoli TaxID=2558242 RepID=UPI0010C1CE9B|nr:hypothetical protein [Halorussus salinisoli]